MAPGDELESHRTVVRFVGPIHIPERNAFPNGAALEPSSAEKAVKPVRVSVWETTRATYRQALDLYRDGRSTIPNTVACATHVDELLPFKDREPRLRVVWDPLPATKGCGYDAHCGIEGLDRPPTRKRTEHKTFLDDLARRFRRISEEGWQGTSEGTHGPIPPKATFGSRRGIVAVSMFMAAVVVAAALVGVEFGKRQSPPPQLGANPLREQQMERRLTEELSAALDESERVPSAEPPAGPPTTKPSRFVYLGVCDSGTWTITYFSGLPSCRLGETPTAEIVAKRGAKVRDALPSESGFGTEVGRLRVGEHVRLMRLHPMLGDVPLPGPKVVWGEIVR